MEIDDTQLHFPDTMSADVLTIEGEIACALCAQPMNQGHIDRGELVALTGKVRRGRGKVKLYVAHVTHFWSVNPATGESEDN